MLNPEPLQETASNLPFGYLGAAIGAGMVAIGAGMGGGSIILAALIEGVSLFGVVVAILIALK